MLRKDCTYDIKVRLNDWPVYGEEKEWVKLINSHLYLHLTLKSKEYDSMSNLCCSINRKIFGRKNDAFFYNYSMELGRAYINTPIENV